MIRQDPILIAAPPRSGTTVLAAVLHAHGVWIGRGRTTRYPGTNMDFASENIDIKSVMKELAKEMKYKNWETPFPDPEGQDMEQNKKRIELHPPEDVPWLVKTSWTLVYWKMWHAMYPNARWLLPVRDIEKIMDSMNRHPGMKKHPDDEKQRYVMALQNNRWYAMQEIKYHCFNIEDFVSRGKQTIESVFSFLDLDPSWEDINSIIQPKMFKR